MTSGTPESTQNWVLDGFQNSLDLASMSPLEAKAMSSSATVTSAPLAQHLRACTTRHASGARHLRAAGHSAHLRRGPCACSHPARLVQPNEYRMRPISVNRSLLTRYFRKQKSCHAFYQVILSAL